MGLFTTKKNEFGVSLEDRPWSGGQGKRRGGEENKRDLTIALLAVFSRLDQRSDVDLPGHWEKSSSSDGIILIPLLRGSYIDWRLDCALEA